MPCRHRDFGSANPSLAAKSNLPTSPALTEQSTEFLIMKSHTWTWMTALCPLGALALTIMFVLTPSAAAQTYRVIYNFTGGLDGKQPEAGLTIDHAGRLYGTTLLGGKT